MRARLPLDIVGRRENGRSGPLPIQARKGPHDLSRTWRMPMSTLMRRPVRRMAMAAGISIWASQAEGHVVLRAGGDDPQGGARASLRRRPRKNRAIAAADHEHADPLREGVLDHHRQVAARFDQEGFGHELPGLHLDHILDFDGCLLLLPPLRIEDQFGLHAAFIRGVGCLAHGFLSYVPSFGSEFIGFAFYFLRTCGMVRLRYLACRLLSRLSLPVIGDTQVSTKKKNKTAQLGPDQESNNGCH